MWRLLVLRFLPRRLVPLLVLFEVVQLVRRLRARNDRDDVVRDERIIEGRATVVPPRAIDGGSSTP